MAEPVLIEGRNGRLTYRLRPAGGGHALAAVLLHGLTGDEGVMWVLESVLPRGSLVVAPRAPFPAVGTGFSWTESLRRGWPEADDFHASVSALADLLRVLEADQGLERSRLVYVGFSQGAALAFAAAMHPHARPAAIVALAGFLPGGAEAALEGLPIFWGHGTRDELVPIARARSDADRLRGVGGRLTFCESDVGHKLGVECLRGLKGWLGETFPGLSES